MQSNKFVPAVSSSCDISYRERRRVGGKDGVWSSSIYLGKQSFLYLKILNYCLNYKVSSRSSFLSRLCPTYSADDIIHHLSSSCSIILVLLLGNSGKTVGDHFPRIVQGSLVYIDHYNSLAPCRAYLGYARPHLPSS